MAPLPAYAQNANSTAARLAALEAAVATLQSGLSTETSARAAADSTLQANINTQANHVAKLEGSITEADLVGTYRMTGLISGLNGGASPEITLGTIVGTATLLANHTGTFVGHITGRSLVGGASWTASTITIPDEGETAITWSYANGTLHVSDGTVNLDTNLNVGIGGRILTFAGLGDDDDVDLIIMTRLQ
jgi:hypothetical protein